MEKNLCDLQVEFQAAQFDLLAGYQAARVEFHLLAQFEAPRYHQIEYKELETRMRTQMQKNHSDLQVEFHQADFQVARAKFQVAQFHHQKVI
jgi:hypothetical protein